MSSFLMTNVTNFGDIRPSTMMIFCYIIDSDDRLYECDSKPSMTLNEDLISSRAISRNGKKARRRMKNRLTAGMIALLFILSSPILIYAIASGAIITTVLTEILLLLQYVLYNYKVIKGLNNDVK